MKYIEVKHILYCSNYVSLTLSAAILVINKLKVFFINCVKMDILFDVTKIDLLQTVSDIYNYRNYFKMRSAEKIELG